ncbi:MAG: DUF3108 domain-containing protein [Acidobacteriia bacterium]|nr:DUF3108 domain-containing protein [Terriglobia bacterium]
MKRLLLATACAMLCAGLGVRLAGQLPTSTIGPVAQIHPPPENYSFPNGQVLVYDAEWRLWTAGTARITVEPAGDNERVSATADSSGVVAVLYPVHDRFQSVVDSRTFCSISIAKHTEEGFRARETLINFDYPRRRAVLDETNLKSGDAKHAERDIPGCVTDVIGGIFYVGSLPLTPDAAYTFPLNDGGETVEVRAHVEARENIKTPAGTFATIRVSPQASSGPLKSRGRVWIWYSDDARHIPVQMRARLFWGTLTLRLVRTEKK